MINGNTEGSWESLLKWHWFEERSARREPMHFVVVDYDTGSEAKAFQQLTELAEKLDYVSVERIAAADFTPARTRALNEREGGWHYCHLMGECRYGRGGIIIGEGGGWTGAHGGAGDVGMAATPNDGSILYQTDCNDPVVGRRKFKTVRDVMEKASPYDWPVEICVVGNRRDPEVVALSQAVFKSVGSRNIKVTAKTHQEMMFNQRTHQVVNITPAKYQAEFEAAYQEAYINANTVSTMPVRLGPRGPLHSVLATQRKKHF
ncbi:hypothetical protein FDJ23_gp259 [Erwinia phage vB_EamM_Desertfox]|uniref:Uncharacterized protein n=4 Tax=Agricanvirus TaxID=1984776 RepID=A0A482IKG7_9CAUD|nr:hypothetical protein FDJ23_gp259 [Erwinia phage vB_EamM_Desertfox]AUG86046.1 hypothetical protein BOSOLAPHORUS_260 [Erwinia phage vB_EamM_Bosolaphorus]AUG86366.1 hypothetical protein DESERTFOX_259 [Erwinia phage vB_EamM_Desertfox]AUG87012.1 hypothetical protein MORTIMER_264 [Erwinia phage vB_EamM_Mortimer]QBP07364.1 hypothetical protein REBECCA_259 [Erwinia phage Rebecca]